jgi:type III pantothenate kinase
MLLLIDIGNTRIKWARVDVRGLGEQTAVVHANWTEQEFIQQVLDTGPKAERVVIGNVGGKRMGDLAQAAVHAIARRRLGPA